MIEDLAKATVDRHARLKVGTGVAGLFVNGVLLLLYVPMAGPNAPWLGNSGGKADSNSASSTCSIFVHFQINTVISSTTCDIQPPFRIFVG